MTFSTLKLSGLCSSLLFCGNELAAIVDLSFWYGKNPPNLCVASDDEGQVSLFVNAGGLLPGSVYTERLNAHKNIVFAVEWLSDSSFLTASGDCTIVKWSYRPGAFVKKSSFLAHCSSVKSLSLCPENESLFVSAGRDGNMFLWDTRCRASVQNCLFVYDKPRITLLKAHERNENVIPFRKKKKGPVMITTSRECLNGITSVKFLANNRIISAAAADSSLQMWDIRKTTPHNLQTFAYPGTSQRRIGYSNIAVSPYEDFFVASCTDSNIYQFSLSASTDDCLSVYNNPGGSSYFTKIDLDPTGTMLLSGSTVNKSFIWDIGCREPKAELSTPLHDQEVACVTWNKLDSGCIATACEGGKISIWAQNFMLKKRYSDEQIHDSIVLFNNNTCSTLSCSSFVDQRRCGFDRRILKYSFSSDLDTTFVSPTKASGSCVALSNLPDFIKQTPTRNNSPLCKIPPSTPKTCPVSRSYSTTPSPRKQFMSNFKSAFKLNSNNNNSSSPSPRRRVSAAKRGVGKGDIWSNSTPLKTSLTANCNRLSPIVEFFRSSGDASDGQKKSSKPEVATNQVKRKLNQF